MGLPKYQSNAPVPLARPALTSASVGVAMTGFHPERTPAPPDVKKASNSASVLTFPSPSESIGYLRFESTSQLPFAPKYVPGAQPSAKKFR